MSRSWHALNGKVSICIIAARGAPDEESRPRLAVTLRQQGIHPHPGPLGQALVSILDDETWDQCEWTNDTNVGLWEPCATIAPLDESPVNGMSFNESALAEAVEVCDLTRLDNEEVEDCDQEGNDGFSDWYGYPSSQDHL